MHLRVVSLALLLPFACASTANISSFSQSLMGGQFILSWSLLSQSSLQINASSPAANGWIGFGFGTTMVGSKAVIGWVSNGVGSIALYDLTGTSNSDIIMSSQQTISNKSVVQSGGVTTMSFLTSFSGAGPQSIIVAIASRSFPSEHDQDEIDLVDFTTGITAAAPDDSIAQRRQTHTVIMALTYGLGFPIGMMCARFLKEHPDSLWFQLHRGIQTLCIVLSMIAFFVIVADVSLTGGTHFSGDGMSHKIVGLVTVILTFLQLINAAIRPQPKTVHRPRWFLSHRFMALCIYSLGLTALILGFMLGDDFGVLGEDQAHAGIGIVVAVQSVLFLLSGFLEHRKNRLGEQTQKEMETKNVSSSSTPNQI